MHDHHRKVVQDHPCISLLYDEISSHTVKTVQCYIVFQEAESSLDPPPEPVEFSQNIFRETFFRKVRDQELTAAARKLQFHQSARKRHHGRPVVRGNEIERPVPPDTDILLRMIPVYFPFAAGDKER